MAAQVTVMPRVGDSVFSLVDNLPTGIDLGEPGPNRVWDFTTLQSPFVRRYEYKQGDSPNSLVIQTSSSSLRYVEREGDVFLSSILNTDPLRIGSDISLRAFPPLLEYDNPVNFNEASSEYSRLIGYIPWSEIPLEFHLDDYNMMDTLRIVLEINRDDAADAMGMLLLQNESYDVIRERRIEEQTMTVWARNSADQWEDVTPTMKSMLADITWNSITYSYIFIADGSPGPIAEVYTNERDEIERVIFSADPKFAKIISPEKRLRGVYVYPNPSFGNVRFEFFNIPEGQYELSVFNLLGKKLWTVDESLKTGTVILSDLSFLPRGTYFYSLIDRNGKRIVTRRLMILKV